MKSYFLRRTVSRGVRRTVTFSKSKSAASLGRSKSGLKLGQKPSATRRKRPELRFPVCTCKCKYFTFVMTLLFFIGAIVMMILYLLKLKKLSTKGNAMVALRKFMTQHNQSFEGKSDAEILAGAEQLAKDLVDLNSKTDEVQNALDSTIKKLAAGWKLFKEHLYYFSKSKLTFNNASQECERMGGMLTDITSAEEEDFIEGEIYKALTAHWIGIWKKGGMWYWMNNNTVTHSYWAPGQPDNWGNGNEDCVEIERCSTKRSCWRDVPCSESKKWICEVMPNPKWL